MERLTDKKEADAQRRAYEKRLKNGYPRNIPEERFLKLAAYEDAGFEPEEILELIRFMQSYYIDDLVYFAEIMQAEKDGRLLVLLCKPEQTVWAESPVTGRAYSFKAPDIEWIIKNTELFGREIFLTREEAEAALKKRAEEDNDS